MPSINTFSEWDGTHDDSGISFKLSKEEKKKLNNKSSIEESFNSTKSSLMDPDKHTRKKNKKNKKNVDRKLINDQDTEKEALNNNHLEVKRKKNKSSDNTGNTDIICEKESSTDRKIVGKCKNKYKKLNLLQHKLKSKIIPHDHLKALANTQGSLQHIPSKKSLHINVKSDKKTNSSSIDPERKSKKKRKRDHTDDNEDGDCLILSEIQMVDLSMEDTNEYLENGENSGLSKKKKLKVSNGKCSVDIASSDRHDNKVLPKKKKKKKKNIDLEDDCRMLNESNNLVVQTKSENSSFTKLGQSKKKRKRNSCEEEIVRDEVSALQTKKNRHNSQDHSQISENKTSLNDSTKPKKKKSKNLNSQDERQISKSKLSLDDSTNRKKKKNKKQNLQNDEEGSKKKSKSKDKHEDLEIMSFDDCSLSDGDGELKNDIDKLLKKFDFSQFNSGNVTSSKTKKKKHLNQTDHCNILANGSQAADNSKSEKKKSLKLKPKVSNVDKNVKDLQTSQMKISKSKVKNESINSQTKEIKSPFKNKFDTKKLADILKKNETTELVKNKHSSDGLKSKMMAQMNAAKFRYLNEQLYTTTGKEARRLFLEDEDAFKSYHTGYQSQLAKWPVNPLSLIIDWLSKKPKNWIVADFGCGEAKLSKSATQKVHSLDLVAASEDVIACDMSNTPLKSASCNVVVFCLSLMGTNIKDFIMEANRVLMLGGIVKIAEVESRFADVKQFIALTCKYGFKCVENNQEHDYFWIFEFKKAFNYNKKKAGADIYLKPCIYKKR